MPSVNSIIYIFFFNFKNYPIKRALNAMVNEDLINKDDDMKKFCVMIYLQDNRHWNKTSNFQLE